MKDIERRKKEKGELKEKRLKRLADRDRQLIKPTVLQQDKERQLRRIATRGVVALFNAIASAKKEVAEAQADEDSKARAEKAAMSGQEIKRMTQANFLDMLKGDKENGKEEEARAERAARALGLVEGDKGDGDSPGDPGDDRGSVGGEGTRGAPAGWKALQEDYFVRSTAALKDWDKGLDSDDGESGDDILADPFAENEDNSKSTKRKSKDSSGKHNSKDKAEVGTRRTRSRK